MPSSNGNGDINLTVGLNTKDAVAQAKQLSSQIDSAIKKSAANGQDSKIAQSTAQMKKAKIEGEKLIATMEKVGAQTLPTQEYIELSNTFKEATANVDQLRSAITKDEDALSKLQVKMEKIAQTPITPKDLTGDESTQYTILAKQIKQAEEEYKSAFSSVSEQQNAGLPVHENELRQVEKLKSELEGLKKQQQDILDNHNKSSQAYQTMLQKAEELKSNLAANTQQMSNFSDKASDAAAKMIEMKQNGTATMAGTESEEYAKLNNQLNANIDKQKVALLHHREVVNKQKEATAETKNTGKEIEKNNKKLKEMPTSMADVSKATKHVFGNILKWGFGIRSTFILIRRLRTAIKEGFQNLIDTRPTSELANQITKLKGSIATLKNAFAAAFSPIVTMALPYIQSLINYILKAINAVGQFFAAITGAKTYTKAIVQSGKAQGGATKATKDNTKATKDNKKAKDEQLKQLASFDELNNLSAQTQEDLNDALEEEPDTGGGAGLANMFEDVPVDPKVLEWLEKIKKAIKPIVDAFKKGFFTALGDWKSRLDDIRRSYNSIKKSIKEIANDPKVKKAFSDMILANAEALGAMVGTFAKAGLIIGQALTGGIAKWLKDNKDRIKKQLVEIFDVRTEYFNKVRDFWYSISYIIEVFASQSMKDIVAHAMGIVSEVFLNGILLIDKLGRDLFGAATQWIVEHKEEIRSHIEDVLGFADDILGRVEQVVQDTFEQLQKTYDEHIKPFLDSIGQGLSDIYDSWNELWETSIKPALDELDQKFKEFVDNNQPRIDSIIENCGKLFDALKKLWEEVLVPLSKWVIEHVGPYVIDFIKTKIEGLMTTISGFLALIESISDVVGGVADAIVKIADGDWAGAWDSIKNSVINAVNGIVDYIKNELLPNLDNVLNAVGIISNPLGSISSYVGTKIGSKVGHFASGGVIPPSASEHLALVGDNNSETEVISPLSTMKQAMIEALNTANLGGGYGDIVIQIDGREVFRAVQTQNNQYKKQTGASAFA